MHPCGLLVFRLTSRGSSKFKWPRVSVTSLEFCLVRSIVSYVWSSVMQLRAVFTHRPIRSIPSIPCHLSQCSWHFWWSTLILSLTLASGHVFDLQTSHLDLSSSFDTVDFTVVNSTKSMLAHWSVSGMARLRSLLSARSQEFTIQYSFYICTCVFYVVLTHWANKMNEWINEWKILSIQVAILGAACVAYIARGTRNGSIAMNSCPDMYYSLTALALCWKLRRCLIDTP